MSDRHEEYPPGTPVAKKLADELADLVVTSGERVGQRWTYVALEGGYMATDGTDLTVCVQPAAVIDHVQGNVMAVPREKGVEG